MNRRANRVGQAIVRLSTLCAVLAVAPAIALADPGTAITVPWVPKDVALPHVAYYNHPVTLKGIVRGGAPTQFMWNFGDGGSTAWASINSAANTSVAGGVICGSVIQCSSYNLSASHAYLGNVNQQFSATLSVEDAAGNITSAVYPIQMYQMLDTTDPVQMDAKVAVAEDEGLWYLHVTQTHTNGAWATHVGGCAAVEAFELHGSKPGQNFDADPYVEDVQLGLNYMLTQSVATGISAQAGGNPDSNGNNLGIYMGGNSSYIDGICGAAFAASAAPNLVATAGPANVVGRAYKDIMQDVVDWFAYGQADNGGWWYSANSSNGDGSTNQWPIVAMLGAQSNMGSTVPAFVKNLIPTFLNIIHNTSASIDNGGYGYQDPNTYPNVAKTGGGIMGNFFVGQTNTSPNVLQGMGLIYRKWVNGGGPYSEDDYNLGASYAMYDVMKSMQAATPPFTRIFDWCYGQAGCTPGTQTTNSFDWYYSPTNQAQPGLAATVMAQQHPDGSFHDTNGAIVGDITLTSGWDTLILMRAVSNVPPRAVICNCSAQWPVNSPVTLDGSCSIEPDQTRSIINPTGYKWDYTYDGTHFVQSLDSNGLAVQGPVVTKPDGFAQFTEDGNGVNLVGGPVFTVALQVTDNTPLSLGGPQSNIATCNVNIKPPPHCPQANIGGPYIGYANVPVQFTALGSTQVDGDPLTYLWDFNNLNHFTDSDAGTPTHIWATGATFPDGGTCAAPNCTVGGNGTYPIELKVTNHPPPNDAGVVPSCDVFAYTTVIIGDHSPVANAGGPYTGLAAGDTVALDGTGSYDPDNNPGGITYAWDLGGAGTYTTSGAKPTFTIPANTPVGNSFPVCLRISDLSAASGKTLTSAPSCAIVTAIKSYSPPTCIVAPVAVQSCNGGFQAVTVDGSHSYDPNGDHFTFAWSTTDCPAFDHPAASAASMQFSTAQGGKFWTPVQQACIPQCTATLTVTNDRNLSSTCTQVIKISDLQTPAFTNTPANTTIECDANASANVANWLASATATDSCSPTAKPVVLTSDFRATAGACGGVGTSGSVNGAVKVTFTAADQCNTNTSQSSATLTIADSKPPVLTLPSATTAEATSASGAVVTYTATANDAATGPTQIHCTPPSGSTFPIATTTVTCTSTDSTNHTATGTFTITVNDHTAPVLSLSSNKTVEATNANGAAVTYTATANDAVDGATAVSCLPASGSVFSIGTTTVNCSSTDVHLNKSIGSFTVTVQDTSPPTITVPSAVTSEATGPTGAIVSFTASAHDTVSGNTPVNCSPVSGSVFPLGPTTVTCTSTDGTNPASPATFTVTVTDKTPPAFSGISQGGSFTLEATGPDGATATDYGVTATDLVDGARSVTCVPSPTLFPLGQTPVSCTASDNHGNTGSLAFTVSVVDTTKPVIICPLPLTIAANGPIGAVNWNVAEPTSDAIAAFLSGASDHDLVDPMPTLVNDAPWMFPVGQTTPVTFTATDAHMNSNTCTANVTVIGEQEAPPSLTCPANAVLTSGAGAELDWNAVFHHPVSVQLLVASGAGSVSPLSVADMGDASFQLSSSPTAAGAYAVRIRAVDQVNGSAVDCNRFLAVTPAVMPADKSKKIMRATVPAIPVRY